MFCPPFFRRSNHKSKNGSTVAIGLLGSARPLDEPPAWFLHDFCTWFHILRNSPEVDIGKSIFHSIVPFNNFIPDGRIIIGEAGCDRLSFRVPNFCSTSSSLSPTEVAELFLFDVSQIAPTLQEQDTLIIVLVGHGGTGRFHLSLGGNVGDPVEAFITKKGLERVLTTAKCRIVLVSTACSSGSFKSDRWLLFCAAGPMDIAASLNASTSNKFRGGAFTYCTLHALLRARRLGERDKQLPPDHDWKDGATPMPRGYTWKWVETWKMALTLRDFLDIARYELKFFLAPRVEFVLLPIVKDFCDRFTPVVEDPLSERPPTDQEQVQVPPLPHQTSSSFFRRPSAYSLRLVGPSPFSAPSSVPLSTKEHQMLLCLAAHAISDPSPPRSRPELVRAYQKARILMKEFNSAVSDSEIAQHDHVSMLNLFRWIEEQREFFRNLALTLGLWEDSQRPWSAIDEFMSGTEIEDRVLYGQVGEWAFNLSCETFIILTYQEPVRWFLSKWEQSGCREIEEQEWRDAVTQTRSQFKTV